ncbi:Ig-like domain-containing protein [Stigmatella sp. ncwal1]|uniref:Ig-like domain-containing protein n=1 Tax=Stigmatella ashevillensis TaxID=2995309 RepID=A0ABT5DBI6_9BACT|nr:Ig-like domain-containing protein [Stigmatella ashevillena]MDC0711025.1 Ig-like domain-containing protein [Stigmatella ashevillena]
MTKLLLLSVGCVLWAGCSVDFTEPAGRSCDDTHACPPSQICVDLRCQPFEESPPDAGLPDAGTPDAGNPDGGSPDAGPTPTVEVSVSPMSASLAPSATRFFSATVSQATDTRVSWSVREGAVGGTIDAAGQYTAPATEGTFHVVATSMEDSSRSATALVSVATLPPNLALHFSADRLNGPEGTMPEEGARVASWADLSGNAHALTQTEENRQPLFKARGLNGLPTVVFDGDTLGSGDYLRTAAFATALAQPVTIFFVYKAPLTDVNKTLLDAPPGVGPSRLRVQATIEPPGALQLYSTKFSSPYLQRSAGTFYFITALFNGPTSRVRANGREEAPSANRDPGAQGMGGFMLGGRQELNADAFAATEFAEVLVFGRALGDPEIEHVETYLRGRYFP